MFVPLEYPVTLQTLPYNAYSPLTQILAYCIKQRL